MHQFVATFRATYKAESEVEANLIAYNIEELVTQEILDEDEEDEIVTTQVIDTEPAVVVDEMLNVLAKARDTLIKTKLQSCVDVAREVDKVCFALEHGDLKSIVPYDYGRFMDRIEHIIKPREQG